MLLWFGNWAANRMVIFYWFYEPIKHQRLFANVPLTNWGISHCLLFNGVCILAAVSHLRAYLSDPGYIPKGIEIPDNVETAMLESCEKCSMNWKPERAHHCSTCNACIFKVS